MICGVIGKMEEYFPTQAGRFQSMGKQFPIYSSIELFLVDAAQIVKKFKL